MERSHCVYGMIAAQAGRTPDAIAVIDGRARVTYRELMMRAHGVARWLAARGVTVEIPVGVSCAPSVEQVVAVLGAIAAGGAYVPIDPDYPDARRRLIVDDARIPVVLTEREVAAAGTAEAPPAVAVGPEHALYVLYTSGSTGVPKGVVGVQRAITSRLRWQQNVYPYADGEIACARTPLGFVDSVAEIFAPLAFGVPLVIVGRDARRDPTRMIAELAAARATRIVVVPALLSTLFELAPELGARLPDVRHWSIGGEPVPVPLAERFLRDLPGRKLINIYGATEVSGDATYYDFDALPPGLATSPIGIPLTGVDARILDEQLRETDVGELCVSGVCVARGYLGRDALTREKFVANPFPEGGLLYRMGDLARRLPGGDLQYLGRIDSLVKIRGNRVELGEVEARLAEHPRIAQAVAVARDDGHGGLVLAAFYTTHLRVTPTELRTKATPVALVAPAELRAHVTPAELRAHLAATLPAYMIPSHLVELAELPINTSAKVDRRALRERPLPELGDGAAPASALERRIAHAWEVVLGRASIGREASFHDLGGTSLQAVRIVAQLRDELGVALALGAIFAHPTIAQLAAHVAGRAAPTQGPAPHDASPAAHVADRATPTHAADGAAPTHVADRAAPTQGSAAHGTGLAGPAARASAPRGQAASSHPPPADLALSHYQFPFWLFRALTGDVSVVADAFAFSGPPDIERLQQAYASAVAAFDTLWMRFPRWRPVQRIAPRRAVRFAVHDRRDATDDATVLAQEAAANNLAAFDLDAPPHIHARLVWLPSGAHRLLVAMPHVTVDMAAIELFRARLEASYAGLASPAAGASLADVVAHEQHAPHGLAADIRYWRELAGGRSWNRVPPRLCAAKLAGARVRAVARREIPPETETALRELARERGASPPLALIGAISAGLRQVLASDDLTLLLMIDKRDRSELRSLFATRTALMPLRAVTGATLGDIIAGTARQVMTSLEHSDHLMRVPTLWNDSWRRAPRLLRRGIERITARQPQLAPTLFALVPFPGARRRDHEILVAVNVLPEVFSPAASATSSAPLRVWARRSIELMLRPGDVIVGSDPLLDRTLQLHVTREDGRIVLNLYGGGIDQAGLDELAGAIVDAAAPATAVVGRTGTVFNCFTYGE